MITSRAALLELCERAHAAASVAFDMEFQRETTYYPKLQLLQVAVGDQVDIIDPLELEDLRPFLELVADPGVEIIVHAGGQDMEIVHHLSDLVPRCVFDTQIGAALVGHGESVNYGALVSKVLGVRLRKLQTGTDWSRRPLTDAQVEYAVEDVRYLPEIRARLGSDLESMGRTTWAEEEMAHYADPDLYSRDPRTLYQRVKGAGKLRGRELAVLQELAIWREEEAARRDRPKGRVVTDDVLLDVARLAPTRIEDLGIFRNLHPRELERSGAAMLDAVARGLAMHRNEWPERPGSSRDDERDISEALDLLEIVMRDLARSARVGPSYLGNRRSLAELYEHVRGRRPQDAPAPSLLTGWRRAVAGDALVDVANGRICLSLDPRSGRVVSGPAPQR